MKKTSIPCNVFTLSRKGKLFPGAPVVPSPTAAHPERLILTDYWENIGQSSPGLPFFADPSVIVPATADISLIERASLRLTSVDLDDFPEDERSGQTHGKHVVHQLANLQPLAGADPAETLIWVPFPVNVEGGLSGGCEGRGAVPFELGFGNGRELGDYRCLLLAFGGKLEAVTLTIKGGDTFFLRAVPGSQISEEVPCPCVTICTPEKYEQSRRALEAAFNKAQVESHFFANINGLAA
jgi:hypothetical protein